MTYMRYLRKSHEVIGFTADADIWCLDCAKATYGADPEGGLREDGEGNTVHPVFLDQAMGDEACGKCHTQLPV
jgi:hypothetical protein